MPRRTYRPGPKVFARRGCRSSDLDTVDDAARRKGRQANGRYPPFRDVRRKRSRATSDRRVSTQSRRSVQGVGPPPRPSLVVLPFANIGGDAQQEYFVDGVTESLTSDLSRIRGSFVIARNTAFAYKGKSVDVRGTACGRARVASGGRRPRRWRSG